MAGNIEVAVKEVGERVVAFVSAKGSYSQIPGVMGQLFGFIQAQGLRPMGPPEGAYFNDPNQVPEGELVWEVRCPLAAQAPKGEPKGPQGLKQLPAMKVAFAIHKGPYDEVGRTYGALMAWISQHGYRIAAGPFEEVYLSNPDTPPQELLTEVRIPVIEP